MMKLLLQIAMIASTFFGTLFVWFETQRMCDTIQTGRLNLTDDAKWSARLYNKSKLGFALLFIGIVLQAVLILLGYCS